MKLIFRKIRAYVKAMRIKNIQTVLWECYDIPIEIIEKIKSLCRMKINDLRATYYEAYGYNSNSRNRDFLTKKIAWKLQANLFGDISEDTKNEAIKIADFSRLKNRKRAENSEAKISSFEFEKRKAVKFSRDPRLPMEGSILSKNHNGRAVTVTVLEKGFLYNNRRYASLSAIAREVSGTNWNGFKFFDL